MRQPLGRKLQVRWQRQGGGIDASGFAAKKYAALRVCKAAYRVLFLCRNNRRLRDLEPEEPREEALLLAGLLSLLLFLVLIGLLLGGLDHRNCSCRGALGLRCGCAGT